MTVTVTELYTRTRYFIRDVNSNTFTNEELLVYLNDSQREIASFLCKQEGDFLLREATTALVQAQVDYNYPSDILGRNIRALWVYSGSATVHKKVERATLEEVAAEGLTQRASPNKYTCLDGYFKIGPPPDASGYTLKITYIRQPTTLSQPTDAMDADDEFKELICVTAAIRALEARGGKESVELLVMRQQALLAEAARLITKEDLIQAYLAWKY